MTERSQGISIQPVVKRLALALGALILSLAFALWGMWWVGLRQVLSESTLVDTRLGPMEYAAVGDGPDVLLIHGSPGGYDQLLPLARSLAGRGYRAITVSRPGYLRTPQQVGSTPEQQADALAALVDALELRRVALIGVSGGGPTTLQLALRHPQRVQGVVLICALSSGLRQGNPDPGEIRELDLMWDLSALVARFFPSRGLRFLGVTDATELELHLADPTTVEAVRYLFQSLGFSGRRHGYVQDMLAVQRGDLAYPLEQIEAPTLVLHGSDDANVPLSHGEHVASSIPGAQLRVLDGAGHAIFVLQHKWIEDQVDAFLSGIHGEVHSEIE